MASVTRRDTASGARYDVVYRCPRGGSCQKHPGGDKQHRRTFPKKADAQRFAHAVEADKSRGAFVDSSLPTTVAEYAATWLESRAHRPSTRNRTRSLIRAHVEGTPLGARRLVNVRASEVQAWATGRSELLAPSTLRLVVKTVRAIFAAAVEDGLIARSPAARVTLPGDDRRVDTTRRLKDPAAPPLTIEQVTALADASTPRHRALVLVQAGLGLRVGELLALRMSDVDWLRRTVCIERQIEPRSRERVSLKTRRSRRTIPLPAPVAQALAEHIAAFPLGEDGLIFASATTGRPYAREVVSRALARAVEKAGLPPATTGHDLRRHCASVLVDAGMSVVEVARWLGDSPEQVVKVYARPMPSWEDKARRAVEVAWEVDESLKGARQL